MTKPVTSFYAGGFLYNPKTASVLLHKRDGNTKINPHKWAFFGGLSEGSETPVQTFTREVKEELNVQIDDSDVKMLCDYLNEELQTYRYVFYATSNLGKDEMTLSEGADFDWIALDELDKYDLTDKTKEDLKTFIETL